MEVAVKYVPTDHHQKLGWGGNKPALCFIGTKHAHCVVNEEGSIHAVKLPIEVVLESTDVLYHGVTYPVDRFVERFKALGKPISATARKLLDSLGAPLQAPELGPKIAKKKAPTKKETAPPAPPPLVEEELPEEGRRRRGPPSTIINRLAGELNAAPTKIRRFLRAQGLRAPYTDEKQLRTVLKNFGKEKTDGKKA